MKMILIILLLAGLGYGAYYFMMQVKDESEKQSDTLNPSRTQLLKDMNDPDTNSK